VTISTSSAAAAADAVGDRYWGFFSAGGGGCFALADNTLRDAALHDGDKRFD
jgi:hypothetical protein